MKKYLLLLLVVPFMTYAGNSHHNTETNIYNTSTPGTTSLSINDLGTSASTQYTDYGAAINQLDEEIAGIASMSVAFSMIPDSSHVSANHKHTSVGVGLGAYYDESAIAIGINHQENNVSLKAAIGQSTSTDLTIGAGAAWTFE